MSEKQTGEVNFNPDFVAETSKEIEAIGEQKGDSVETEYKDKILKEIEIFENRVLPLIDDLISYSEDEEGYSGKSEELLEYLGKLNFLSSKTYIKLSHGEKDPQFVHDLNNFAAMVLGFTDLLLKNGQNDFKKKKKYLIHLKEKGLPYAMIMEDLLSRDVNGDIRSGVEKRNIKLKNVFDSIKSLADSSAVDGLVKKKIKFGKLEDLSLVDDEEIVTSPGVIVNSLMNMVKNSCKERIEATAVEFVIKREGNEIVFRVIDNGLGMRRQHLEKDYAVGYKETPGDEPFEKGIDSGFIFDKGGKSSGTGSTGLGLADLDKRIESLGGVLRVASKRKFAYNKRGEQVNFTTEIDKEKLPDIELKSDQSTIFEIRLPITKKKSNSAKAMADK